MAIRATPDKLLNSVAVIHCYDMLFALKLCFAFYFAGKGADYLGILFVQSLVLLLLLWLLWHFVSVFWDIRVRSDFLNGSAGLLLLLLGDLGYLGSGGRRQGVFIGDDCTRLHELCRLLTLQPVRCHGLIHSRCQFAALAGCLFRIVLGFHVIIVLLRREHHIFLGVLDRCVVMSQIILMHRIVLGCWIATRTLMRHREKVAVSTTPRHSGELLLPAHVVVLHAREAWHGWQAVHARQARSSHRVHSAQLPHVTSGSHPVVVVLHRLIIRYLLLLLLIHGGVRSARHGRIIGHLQR